METFKLNNGLEIPAVGFGVYKIEDEVIATQSVLDALEVGYRLIDTAQLYVNEQAVGDAIIRSGLPREDIFVTTKVWPSNAGYDKAKASIVESMAKLQLDYVDCIMIHQPFGDYYGTYRALEELYHDKVIRSVGVSNFYPDHLLDIIHYNKVVPVLNQIEAHVFAQRLDEVELMQELGVVPQAWSPLARGENNLFKHELLTEIGNQYHKTPAQVALKYLIQRGISVIPKSVRKERMKENIDLFDFTLSESDLERIKELDHQFRFTDHTDVEAVKAIMNRTF